MNEEAKRLMDDIIAEVALREATKDGRRIHRQKEKALRILFGDERVNKRLNEIR